MCSSAEAEQCDELCEKVNVRDTNSTSHEEIYCLCRFDVDDHHISVRVKPRDENDGVIVNCTSKTLHPAFLSSQKYYTTKFMYKTCV